MWEDEHHLYVEAELPGFSLDDLAIYVTGENQLNIKSERKLPTLEKGALPGQQRDPGRLVRRI